MFRRSVLALACGCLVTVAAAQPPAVPQPLLVPRPAAPIGVPEGSTSN